MQQSPTIRTLYITFNLPIFPRQLAKWRGAFIEMTGWQHDFFHNHNGADQFHYRYPLIQYRMRHKKAGIFAINEGVEALQQVISDVDWEINWQGEKRKLQIEDIKMNEHQLKMLEKPKAYHIYKYLALNGDNYQKWQQTPDLIDKIPILRDTLTGHLLGLAETFQWQLPERLEVQVQNLFNQDNVKVHDTHMIAFNLKYAANIDLPWFIALGKAVSHGYGWQMPVVGREKRQRKITEKAKALDSSKT